MMSKDFNLVLHRYQRKLGRHLRPVEVATTHTDPPFVSFGAAVQLESGGARLAVELDEEVRFFMQMIYSC